MSKLLKSGASGVVAVILIVLWILGMGHVMAGIIAGTLLVFGLMMTIERLPGFWTFACSGAGMTVVIIGTAILSHMMFGTDSVMGMIALCWSLVFKVMVIDGKRKEMGYLAWDE